MRVQREHGHRAVLIGVGALAADFYLRTGYMPLPQVGMQPRRSRVLSREHEIQALVAYVASLGQGRRSRSRSPSAAASRGLAAVHRALRRLPPGRAEGGYLTGAVPPPLEHATPTQVAEAIASALRDADVLDDGQLRPRSSTRSSATSSTRSTPTTAAAGRSATSARAEGS
jgi:ubiquinol-cytochrome c reductase cytochrome c subunit